MAHIRFDEDIENYSASDSEDEYTEREKDLLKKVRTKRATHSDSEEEVFGLDAESSDDSDIAEKYIDTKDDDLPDVRAWGQNKRAFYSTDYVDLDYGGFQGKDAHAADLEEQEARSLQKRLAEQLDDDDFTLDVFNKNKPETDVAENYVEVIQSDLSSLSKRQIFDLLHKESPEFFDLLEDYKEKVKIVKGYLAPAIELFKKGMIAQCSALEFVKTYYQLILNYITNINMYLLLKASRINVKHHPVIKRLYQYRQLIAQLEPNYVAVVKPQLEIIIEGYRCKDKNEIISEHIRKRKIKKLKILENIKSLNYEKVKLLMEKLEADDSDVSEQQERELKSILKTAKKEIRKVPFELLDTENPSKKHTSKKEIILSSDEHSEEEVDEKEEIDEKEEEEGKETGYSKRVITYQMAKNKGLTPRRKKEQRNPRVKHRNKYKKAVIRRKGAVREVRRELTRYGGEISGIKASVSKSIKIK